MLCRKRSHPAHIAITGASSGIGAELAYQYAAPGKQLALFARRKPLLDEVAALCRDKGAVVTVHAGDVREPAKLQAWFDEIDAVQPVDLLVANAGIFDGHGPDGQLETPEEAKAVIDTNLLGAIYTAQAALPAMLKRRSGHVAFINSLAAVLPLADAPAYSASKGALQIYSAALRRHVSSQGIVITTVLLGHVATEQTKIHIGRLDYLISASVAASAIKRSCEKRKPSVSIPFIAGSLSRVISSLPPRLQRIALKNQKFYVQKPKQMKGIICSPQERGTCKLPANRQ